MYPFGDLPANVAAFCGRLRRDHGFLIDPGAVAEAVRALEAIDLADEAQVRDALRSLLSHDQTTASAFDGAFDAFFFPGPPGVLQDDLPLSRERGGPGQPTGRRPGPRGKREDGTAEPPDTLAPAVLQPDEIEPLDEAPGAAVRSTYSASEGGGTTEVALTPVSPAWQAAAARFVRQLQVGLSRRWRPGRTGRRIDLRRTWRASLHTGGEALVLRRLSRVRRQARLLVFADASRSMHGLDRRSLDLLVALASATRRVEVFVFSTALARVTRAARAAAAGQPVTLALGGDVWGGGTRIGAALATAIRRHGDRHLGRDTIAIVVSDGLDVGEPDVLRGAMALLARRAAAVVWLNPLADTPGYAPTSRGMAVALPFVSLLAPVPAADGLARLAARLGLG